MADERDLRVLEAVDDTWRPTADVASAAGLSRHAALVVLRGLLRDRRVQLERGSHQVGHPPQLRHTYMWRRPPLAVGYPHSGSAFTSTVTVTSTAPARGSDRLSPLAAAPLPATAHA